MAAATRKTSAKKKSVSRKSPSKQKPAPSMKEATLITGASGGIGEALAGEFAKGGSNLILVARSKDKLEAIATRLMDEHGIVALALPADLSKPNAGRRLYEAVIAKGVHVETLVNNAGVLEMGAFADISTKRHLELTHLNVTTLTELTSLFVPGMVERKDGRILNVASIAAFQPIPSLATYAATKAYVLSLTESLSEELKPHGITATALCPGMTATDMVASAKESNETAAKIPDFMVSDVAGVAAEGYSACMKGEVIRVPGMVNLAAAVAGRASPRWLVRAVSGALGRLAL
ncbi:SDR family oxidoreductase [Parvibaculaceae bacterium PLY_AMNH_Bact1]|nr:SDR family oxidoreductase [Parvibaculaceae bacterium PLY_AMNH_Bact1]